MATNTTATSQNHNGTGSQNNFAISFSFLANTEVDVKVGGVLKTLGTHYNIVGSEVQFTSGNTPPSGTANVVLTRDTNISAKKVDFADGSVLTETDLDNNSDQILFAQQEIINDFVKRDGTQTLTGNLVFEGATDDGNETTLAITDPTADRTISVPDRSGTLITSGDTGTVTSTMIADGTIVNADVNASAAIAQSKLNIANATTSAAGYQSAADKTKLDGIESNATADQTAAEIRTLVESASDSNVFTDADHTKLNGIETGATADQTNAEIRAAVEAASDSNVFTDADHSKLNAIEANATADQTASEIKTLYESNSNTNALTDAEKAVIDGVTANTSELNKLDGFTGSTADLNQLANMQKATAITDDDTKFPTSGAIVDYVAAQLAPIGGLEAIANENSFPNTQPQSGVVISIADAGGLAVSSTGTASGQTVGGTTVNISGIASNFRGGSVTAGVRFLVVSTGSGQNYTYHKATLREDDLVSISGDINDFSERYRVGSTNPTTSLDSGDLFFNTSTGKLLIYNGTNSAWEESQSVGNFFISTLSPAFNGSVQDFTITNAPSNAQQIILSINGVIQKPNSGTSTPSEGFALSGSTVKLAAAPASGSDYFAIVLGSTVNIGTPSNNTVTSAMIVDGSIVNGDISNSADIAGSKLSLVSTSSTAGIIVKGDGSSDGYLQLNCSQNSHGIKLKSPPHSAGQSYTLTFPSNIVNGQFLTTDANGNLSWAAVVTDLVNDTSPQLGGNLDANGHHILFDDNEYIKFGNGAGASNADLRILHDGTNNVITSDTGTNIRLVNHLTGGNETMAQFIPNGAAELYHNGSKKLETTSDGITVTGNLLPEANNTRNIGNGSTNFNSIWASTRFRGNDNVSLQLGNSVDFKIRHDGTHNLIEAPTGADLKIMAGTGDNANETCAIFNHNGAVELYHNNVKKLETGSDRVNITGHIFLTDGSRLYLSNGFGNGHATIRNDAVNTAGNMVFTTRTAGGSDTSRAMFTTDGHFIPYANNTYDLGSTSQRWRNVYTNDLNLSNEGSSNDVDGTWGSYTIQEGADDLFLINKRNGKKYKFNLTEVS